MACAGSASAAQSTAPQVMPLAPSSAKASLANKQALRAPEPKHHHEMRGTLMPDGSVKLDCEQVAGSIEASRRTDAPIPTEPK
jgi:hypothetical protein